MALVVLAEAVADVGVGVLGTGAINVCDAAGGGGASWTGATGSCVGFAIN